MSEHISESIVLDVEGWLDAPQPIIEVLQARKADKVIIDAADAPAIPAQVAQLLIAAQQTALMHDGAFEIRNPSEAAKRSLATLGLSDLLQDEDV